MVITSHQSHICPHCQFDSGHWFYHNFLRNFAPNLSNLMMHHIIPYQILQNPHVLNWFFRRRQMQYHSFTGHSRILFHEQLKLAGAARGLPGDHGPPKSSFFLTSTIYHHTAKLVVTNPAVRRGTAPINA